MLVKQATGAAITTPTLQGTSSQWNLTYARFPLSLKLRKLDPKAERGNRIEKKVSFI